MVIEIDGSSHNDKQEYDAIRQSYLEGLGLKVIRIYDKDVKINLDDVIRYLEKNLKSDFKVLPRQSNDCHPFKP
ncbi:DUF559 domain-containing protein [Francisellaceae bacterium CB300]